MLSEYEGWSLVDIPELPGLSEITELDIKPVIEDEWASLAEPDEDMPVTADDDWWSAMEDGGEG